MLPQDLLLTSWESLWAHRLRTALSVLGIVIGIASFSLMYSIGETARQRTLKALKALGGDIFQVTYKADPESDPNKEVSFTLQDVSIIKKTCPSILDVSPELNTTAIYYRGGEPDRDEVKAVLPSYFSLNQIKLSRGRLFTGLDMEHDLQVCLIPEKKATELFPGKDPLAQKISINGYLFKVIGVLEKTHIFFQASLEQGFIIPLPIAQRLFPDEKISRLYFRGTDTQTAMSEMKQFLFRRFGNAPFEIQSQRLLLKAQQTFLRIIEYILVTIGSIALMVGGIGIMNIMLVSVTERVREIGIRRALGATRLDIKLQFLCESILLCVLGGLGGTLLGFAGSRLISRLVKSPTVFSVKVLLLSVTMATILGMICGTYPAARAANQDPTIVLRYE
jgi:putative ABC transport system permease protein